MFQKCIFPVCRINYNKSEQNKRVAVVLQTTVASDQCLTACGCERVCILLYCVGASACIHGKCTRFSVILISSAGV